MSGGQGSGPLNAQSRKEESSTQVSDWSDRVFGFYVQFGVSRVASWLVLVWQSVALAGVAVKIAGDHPSKLELAAVAAATAAAAAAAAAAAVTLNTGNPAPTYSFCSTIVKLDQVELSPLDSFSK